MFSRARAVSGMLSRNQRDTMRVGLDGVDRLFRAVSGMLARSQSSGLRCAGYNLVGYDAGYDVGCDVVGMGMIVTSSGGS